MSRAPSRKKQIAVPPCFMARMRSSMGCGWHPAKIEHFDTMPADAELGLSEALGVQFYACGIVRARIAYEDARAVLMALTNASGAWCPDDARGRHLLIQKSGDRLVGVAPDPEHALKSRCAASRAVLGCPVLPRNMVLLRLESHPSIMPIGLMTALRAAA